MKNAGDNQKRNNKLENYQMDSTLLSLSKQDRKAYTRTQIVKNIEELEEKAKTDLEKQLVATIKMLLEYTDY